MRCPEDEIGSNSVNPCTNPSTSAWLSGNVGGIVAPAEQRQHDRDRDQRRRAAVDDRPAHGGIVVQTIGSDDVEEFVRKLRQSHRRALDLRGATL